MADRADGERLRTALVVLATAGAPPGAAGYTAAGGVPDLAGPAEVVRAWFAGKGFQVDPLVGIAFAISGPERVFRATFDRATDAAVELDQAVLRGHLDEGVLGYVAAVSVGAPPDFGPGRP